MECLLRPDEPENPTPTIDVLILILMECLLSTSTKNFYIVQRIGLNPYSNGMLT